MTEFDKSEGRASKFYGTLDGDDSVDGKRGSGSMLGGDSKPPPKKPPGSDDDYSGALYRDVNVDKGNLSDFGDLDPGIGEHARERGLTGDDPDASDRSRKMYDKSKAAQDGDGPTRKDHSKDAKLGKSNDDDSPSSMGDGYWPSGYEPDDSVVAEFDSLAKKRGLNHQEREEMIGLYAREMHRHQKEGAAVIDAWADKARQDPELSANFDAKVAQAQEVLKQYGTQEFVDLLAGTGLGNHPEVIRVFTRIARDIKHLLGRV